MRVQRRDVQKKKILLPTNKCAETLNPPIPITDNSQSCFSLLFCFSKECSFGFDTLCMKALSYTFSESNPIYMNMTRLVQKGHDGAFRCRFSG